jgi:hypothetical protein
MFCKQSIDGPQLRLPGEKLGGRGVLRGGASQLGSAALVGPAST